MKRILIFLITIVCLSSFAPKFLVIDKRPTGVLDNCIVTVIPLNKKAENFSQVFITKDNKGKVVWKEMRRDVLVGCENYNLGDTLILDKKHFTNRKIKASEKYTVFTIFIKR